MKEIVCKGKTTQQIVNELRKLNMQEVVKLIS
jgi:hypothetical protein